MLRNIIAVCLLTFATGKILFYDVLLEPSWSCFYIFKMFNFYIYVFKFHAKIKNYVFWTIYIWYIRFKIYLNTADMSCALIYIVFNKFFISLYIINIFNNYCSVLYVYIKSISIFFSSSNAVFSFSFFIYNNVLFPLFINNVLKMAYRARS